MKIILKEKKFNMIRKYKFNEMLIRRQINVANKIVLKLTEKNVIFDKMH